MSDSLVPISDEQAKLGQEILKTFRALGSFIDKALGSTPEDLVGYFGGDRLRVRRAENMAKMLYEAKARLEARDVEATQPATLAVALPILQGAADEDRDELVDLWARLLASAMDPHSKGVRYAFIEAVRRMDPMDALVCKALYEGRVISVWPGQRQNSGGALGMEELAASIGTRIDSVDASVRNLENLHFLRRDGAAGTPWLVNALCREFMRACYPETDPG